MGVGMHQAPGRGQEGEKSGPRTLPGPTRPLPGQWAGTGARAALMRRCCCCDSALQRCLHLFYFSIIKTELQLSQFPGRGGWGRSPRWAGERPDTAQPLPRVHPGEESGWVPWVVPPGDTALAAPGRAGWGAYTLIQTLLSQLTAAATAVLD